MTVYGSVVVTAVLNGLSATELGALRDDGIVVCCIPHGRLRRMPPRAKLLEVLPAHVETIARGRQSFVEVDTRESASP
jgi:hypothetical protein